jgi:hypothetical protein
MLGADTLVSGETATTIADGVRRTFRVPQPVFRFKLALIKQAGTWVIDGFEFLGRRPAPSGTTKLSIKAQEYAFILDRSTIPGKVAFSFANVGIVTVS